MVLVSRSALLIFYGNAEEQYRRYRINRFSLQTCLSNLQ
jgi:hypothetical protein